MKHLTLQRFLSTSEGTIGRLCDGNKFICFSLEREWASNESNISCIPESTYLCKFKPDGSPSFQYPLFEVEGVEGRSAILIHGANYRDELQGCIALGDTFQVLSNLSYFISNSRDALRTLVSYVDNEDFKLTIKVIK